MPLGIFILMLSPLKFILCSPPVTATSNGIEILAFTSRSAPPKPNPPPPKPSNPSKPPPKLLLNLAPPPPNPPEKIFFKISFRSPISAEPLAKSWKF